ncbi:MAG TPA: class I tRNA ligase family protein, partial [Catalimonadaceae bacterium]|nr:class I tRNA ligase family protein [Catalimonadaceae bacterium]
FNLPIIPVQEGPLTDISKDDFDAKAGTMINSDFLNGLPVKEAIKKATEWAEAKGIGKGKINYRMRDAIFGRQRYWGEPVPVYYENGIPKALPLNELPLILPEIDLFKPTETGEPPLARAKDWLYEGKFEREFSTMPGWAGSSWYFLRYMDPKNSNELVSQKAEKYWQQVDLYIGGTEHATGHLLYSRFWHKFLKDKGFVTTEEPFKKLVNQGMIQGRSNVVYRISGENRFVSKGLVGNQEISELYVDVNLVKNDILDIEAFKKWRTDFADANFELENGQYICGWEVEKMSKSKYNVVNPDDICSQYGADTLRLYEMFLGPLEQSKPWNTNGIEGVFRFLRKLWRLFVDENGQLLLTDSEPTKEELKSLHKVIKKTREDIENLSLNTSVSSFMVGVNELSAMKSKNKSILTDFLICLAPYAPHIAEELWSMAERVGSVTQAAFPTFNPAYLIDDEVEYPVSINGKVREKLIVPADTPAEDIEKQVLAMESVTKWLEGKTPKKIIVVPKKIVNVVV